MRFVPYTNEDFDLLVALETDPVVMRDLGGPVPAGQLRSIHDKWLANIARGDRYFTVVPTGATGPVGVIGIWRTPWQGGEIHELGLLLRPGHQRQRVGFQAVRKVIAKAAAERICSRLHAFVAVTNLPANQGCVALGFTLLDRCDLDYEGRPLRCNHWVIEVTTRP